MKSDSLYITLMLERIEKIHHFILGISLDGFLQNEMMQGAVLIQLEQLGELAKRVSPETKSEILIEWKKVAGFRDVIVHQYFDVRLPEVWKTISTRIPPVEKALRDYLEAHPLPTEKSGMQ